MVRVKLMSWTNKPVETIYWAFMNMHNKVPDSLDDIKLEQEELNSFMEMLCKQPHQTVFEYVNTVWKIDDASRAFQQQLTRTRQAAYSIQSLRIVNVGQFAEHGDFTTSNKLMKNEKALAEYDAAMLNAQASYNKLIALGCPVEDARGVLPLNIHSPITMAINLRALYHMLELRFCENTQEEYRDMAIQMKHEVATKMHPHLAAPMKPLCFKLGKCPSPVYCGKYDFPREVKMDVSRWIKG